MPISAAEVIGSVSKEILINNLKNDNGQTVNDFLQPPLELVGVGENISNVVKLFNKSETFLVLDKGKPITVLTKSEIEDFMSESENL
jgi:cystathionine beta-synthase